MVLLDKVIKVIGQIKLKNFGELEFREDEGTHIGKRMKNINGTDVTISFQPAPWQSAQKHSP
jgi:hypothetical protein